MGFIQPLLVGLDFFLLDHFGPSGSFGSNECAELFWSSPSDHVALRHDALGNLGILQGTIQGVIELGNDRLWGSLGSHYLE